MAGSLQGAFRFRAHISQDEREGENRHAGCSGESRVAMKQLYALLVVLTVAALLGCPDKPTPTDSSGTGATATPSSTPTAARTSTPSSTGTPTPSLTPTASPTPTPTRTATPTSTPSPVPTAGTYIVRGTVFDAATRVGIPGATVKLINFDHQPTTFVQTSADSGGRYLFYTPYCGTCFAVADHPDYYGGAQAFAGTTSPETVVDFFLSHR